MAAIRGNPDCTCVVIMGICAIWSNVILKKKSHRWWSRCWFSGRYIIIIQFGSPAVREDQFWTTYTGCSVQKENMARGAEEVGVKEETGAVPKNHSKRQRRFVAEVMQK